MKKIICIIWFFMILSPLSTVTTAASSHIESDATITLVDEKGNKETEDSKTEDIEAGTVNQGESKSDSTGTSSKGRLLQTDEVLNSCYPLVGLFLILLVILLKERRRED